MNGYSSFSHTNNLTGIQRNYLISQQQLSMLWPVIDLLVQLVKTSGNTQLRHPCIKLSIGLKNTSVNSMEQLKCNKKSRVINCGTCLISQTPLHQTIQTDSMSFCDRSQITNLCAITASAVDFDKFAFWHTIRFVKIAWHYIDLSNETTLLK